MKKIVIFIVTVLFLGVVSMYSCIGNSKRIKEDKIKDYYKNGQLIMTECYIY